MHRIISDVVRETFIACLWSLIANKNLSHWGTYVQDEETCVSNNGNSRSEGWPHYRKSSSESPKLKTACWQMAFFHVNSSPASFTDRWMNSCPESESHRAVFGRNMLHTSSKTGRKSSCDMFYSKLKNKAYFPIFVGLGYVFNHHMPNFCVNSRWRHANAQRNQTGTKWSLLLF